LPTKARPENTIITLFVSAYENGSWKNAQLTFPDQEQDGGIDGLAVRADGEQLAIEHTIVEPFLGDIADQAEMTPMFPSVENDASLVVPDIWIRVFVPIGTLHLQQPRIRAAITNSLRDWLRMNRLLLPKGDSEHLCTVDGVPNRPDLEIRLTLKVVDLPGDGALNVRRQEVGDTLGDVVDKMLVKKLSKLVKTPALKRILILERQHMNLDVDRILQEIAKRRSKFPELICVHEIWIAEKIPFFQPTEGDVRFELHKDGHLMQSFDFRSGKLQGEEH